ncbi:MAG: hypothetical protein M5U25_17305 [Planctomycetota bacterium]|nr:hypothetical protein [Planctomycetota bacterium]
MQQHQHQHASQYAEQAAAPRERQLQPVAQGQPDQQVQKRRNDAAGLEHGIAYNGRPAPAFPEFERGAKPTREACPMF